MTQPKLHARQKKLLYLLGSSHEITTGRELSARLGISERTIRNDIVYMNEMLSDCGIQIHALHRKGYRIQIENRSAFHQLLSGTDGIETKEDRIRHLLQLLIEADDWLDLGELEDTLFVSRTTLESDIREICTQMSRKRPYLQLERQDNTLRFEQDERKLRSVLIRLYSENWDYDSREGIILKDSLIDTSDLNRIRLTIKEILREHEVELDDYGMVYLMLTVAVSYIRILNGRSLGIADDSPGGNAGNSIRQTDSTRQTGSPGGSEPSSPEASIRAAARQIFSTLSAALSIAPGPEEYQWLGEIAAGLFYLNYGNLHSEPLQQSLRDKYGAFQQRLLTALSAHYGMDFKEDDEFCRALLIFMKAIQNPMIPVQTQGGFYREAFLKKYPIAGDMACYICRWLSEAFHLPLGQEERSFLLPLLIVALKKSDRQRGRRQIRTAVVSHYDMGLSNYLMDTVRYCYGEKMDILGPYSIYDRDKIDEKSPSLILTTVKMDIFRKFEAPVIVLTSLMEEPDRQRINACLDRLLSQQEIARLPRPRESYFHSELDIHVSQRAALEEILTLCLNNMKQKNYISSDTVCTHMHTPAPFSSVPQPPQAIPGHAALLKNGVLFWYAFGPASQPTALSLVHLKHRASFEGSRCVQAVIVMIIKPEESIFLPGFYQLAKEIAEHYKEE